MKTITLEVIDMSDYFKKTLAKQKKLREDESERGRLAGLKEETKAKTEAAKQIAKANRDADEKSSSDTAGMLFDLALGAGAAIAAVPTGGMSLAAVPAVLGTGLMAKQASKSIREGVTEGDAEKALTGVGQAGQAYASGGGLQAKTDQDIVQLMNTGGFDALDDDQINRLLELEELKRYKA